MASDYVLVVSIHKAGTNLVAKLIRALGYTPVGLGIGESYPALIQLWRHMGYVVDDFAESRPELIELIKRHYGRGTAIFTHRLASNAAIMDEVRARAIPMLFHYRDPRDVLVSEIEYLVRTPPPITSMLRKHAALLKCTTIQERISHCLEEWTTYFDHEFRENAWLLDAPVVCKTSFEELIGPQGGGSSEKQLAACVRVMEALDVWVDAESVRSDLFDSSVRTFRQGQVGSWRRAFTEVQCADFVRQCGDILIHYGYV